MAAARATRALLDELMGTSRNANLDSEEKTVSWKDSNICTYHLCGWCPIRALEGTKAHIGTCNQSHNEIAKMQFETEKWSKQRPLMERWRGVMSKLEREYEFRCKKAEKTLEEHLNSGQKIKSDAPSSPQEPNRAMRIVMDQIEEVNQRAEDLGSQGKVEEAKKLLQQIEILNSVLVEEDVKRKAATVSTARLFHNFKVCEVCGGLQDQNEEKLKRHNGGVTHMGFARFRTELKRMNEIFEKHKNDEVIKEELEEEEEKPRSRSRDRRRRRQSRSRSRDRRRSGGRRDRNSSRRDRDSSRRSRRNRDRY